MSFFFKEVSATAAKRSGESVPIALLHQLECQVCPLDKVYCLNPKMAPTGAKHPTVYMLGEAPGATEDKEGKQFVGESGQFLRQYIPKRWEKHLRWNNCVRTRPPKNRTPSQAEVEACRPSVERDIAATKPFAIFGFGSIPLRWALGVDGIKNWRGRRVPLLINGHPVWFYPMYHPSYMIRMNQAVLTKTFEWDLDRAFADLDTLDACAPPPSKIECLKGIEVFDKGSSSALKKIEQALHEFDSPNTIVGIDIETEGTRPYSKGDLLCWAVGTKDRVIAVPKDHPKHGWSGELRDRVDAAFVQFLVKSKCLKIAHNVSFELEWLIHRYGRELVADRKRWGCTMVQAYLLDERNAGEMFKLNTLTRIHFGFWVKDLCEVSGRVAHLRNEPIKSVLEYCAVDAKWAAHLFETQRARLQELGMENVYTEQVRRVPTITLTQLKGLHVDQTTVAQYQQELTSKLDSIHSRVKNDPDVKRFSARAHHTLNPLSNPDLVVFFRDVLQRTEGNTGVGYSTDESVLKRIDHPVSKLILELRTLTKLKSTYLDSVAVGGKFLHGDEMIHTTLNSVFTDTGRLSSDSPNIQNYPKREHAWIRKIVYAPEGYMFCAMDHGQLEARVIAMASKDKVLVDALWTGYDIHMDWAKRFAEADGSLIGGKEFLDDPKVMKKFRSDVKNKIVFPAFFGSISDSIAENLGISTGLCSELMAEFWDMFVGVKKWQDELRKFYYTHGYVECLTGRRRHYPLRSNQIINTPIQGTASDIVIDGMNRASEWAQDHDFALQPILNIHDDLTFRFVVEEPRFGDCVEVAIDSMLACEYNFINVPLTVEVSVGKNWYEMKEVGTFSTVDWK